MQTPNNPVYEFCASMRSVYAKDCILDGIKIVRNHSDSVIWLKMDRHFLKTDSDVYIAGVYVHDLII